MAAAESEKKRNLSLDLVAATKENEERLKVWATLSSNERSGTTNISDIGNKSQQSEQQGSHLYTRKKRNRKDTETIDISNTPTSLQAQSPEYKKKWFQKCVSWRYCMVLLLQSAFVVGMFMKNCLPVAMVCMVKPRHPPHSSVWSNGTGNKTYTDGVSSQPVIESVSFSPNDTHSEVSHYEFDWSAEVQGLVLTSILFSTFLGPLMVAVVQNRIGLKWTMTLMNLSGTLLTILSPEAARISPYCLVVIRLLLGLTIGGTTSVVGDCIAWWGPQDEKLTMISLSFTGVNIGTIFASLLSGYLCLMPWDNGWPFVFYTFGAISFIWVICWHFLSSLKPEDHPYISEKEKQYIISYRAGMDTPSGKKVKPPYRKVITSVPVLAYFVAASCHVWSTQVLFTYLPTFFNKQMKFAVQETGLLTSLISLFRMLGSFWWTILGNKTVPFMGVNKSRKMCICVGYLLTGASVITVGFFDDHYRWVVTGLLIFIMINQSVGSSAIQALPLDMAPRYAGLVSGMNKSLASFLSISGPLLTAAVTTNGTLQEWHTVWILMGCMFIAGAIVFLIFGHATPQPWADGKEDFNIFSTFITMGRRFSTFLEAPPISPVSPTNKRFVFQTQLQTNSENILSHKAATSPEMLYVGHFELGRIEANKETLESKGDLNDSTKNIDDDRGTNNERCDYEEVVKQSKPVRGRDFSEFGLEVLQSKETIDNNFEGLEPELLNNNVVGLDTESLNNNVVGLDTESLNNNVVGLDTESLNNNFVGLDTESLNNNVVGLDTESLNNNVVGLDTESLNNNVVGLDTESLNNNVVGLDTESLDNNVEGLDTESLDNNVVSLDTSRWTTTL